MRLGSILRSKRNGPLLQNTKSVAMQHSGLGRMFNSILQDAVLCWRQTRWETAGRGELIMVSAKVVRMIDWDLTAFS